MQIRGFIGEIESHSKYYLKEDSIDFLEPFLLGYTVANDFWYSEKIDRTFICWSFRDWLKKRLKETMDESEVPPTIYFPDYIRLIVSDVQSEFPMFFELSKLFLDEYEREQSVVEKEDSFTPREQETLWYFINLIAMRPGMFLYKMEISYFYYYFSGYCLAYQNTDTPHDEIDEKFCTWFGEWLALWIQDNIDADYIPESKFWYETVIHYTPEGKDALTYCFELCNLFFDDYYNACGYFSWREKADIKIETDLGTKMGIRDVIVRVDGIKYKLFCVTIKILQSQFEDEALQACPGFCSSQPNMVVVKEITEEVETIVQKWYRRDYFKKILPVQ